MRRKVIIAFVLVSCVFMALLLWRGGAQTRTLPDGSRLVLSGVRAGRTNVYLHGTFLSRSVGRFVHSNGLSIAKIRIARPTKVMVNAWSDSNDVLSAQFQLYPESGGADHFLKQPFYRKFRLLVTGDDGFSYVHEFHPYEFQQYDDGIYAYLYAQAWPRTSRRLRIRLEERAAASIRDFREVARFVVKNPRRVKARQWTATQPFRTNLPGNVDVEVGELVLREGAIHSSDIWENTAELPVRFTSNGQALTNWGIHYGPINDASGNRDSFSAIKGFTNGWTVYRIFRVLDPKVPWRFDVNFALDSNYPQTNLFSFDAPWPMSGKTSTNFAGVPATIDYVNTDMLAVELPGKPPHLRVSFVDAVDDQGRNLAEWSGSWSQHRFWKLLSMRNQKQVNVRATIAIHPNYPASFTLQPRYEKPKDPGMADTGSN